MNVDTKIGVTILGESKACGKRAANNWNSTQKLLVVFTVCYFFWQGQLPEQQLLCLLIVQRAAQRLEISVGMTANTEVIFSEDVQL